MIDLAKHSREHERRAHASARPLECERGLIPARRTTALEDDAALRLAADQGVALRGVIAHSASAVTLALLDVAAAIRESRVGA